MNKTYSGLTSEEVRILTEQGEVNESENRLTRTKKEIFRKNILTWFNFINICLFAVVAVTGRFRNGLFMGTVLFNTCIGIFQELRAKKLLDQAYIMNASKTTVVRDGKEQEISPSEIVRGDLIVLDSGDQIPVDGEVLDGYIEVDESILTGESDHIGKEKDSSVSAGTVVTAGKAYIRADRIGKECTAAKIMAEAKKYKRAKSTLHADLEKLLKIVSFVIVPVTIGLYFFQKMVLDMVWYESALKTVAAAVGMIPEGLVVLTSIALAVSTMRLLSSRVLVQDLFSIESLARVDMLCLDKTGTLTQGKMETVAMEPLNGLSQTEAEKLIKSYFYNEEKPNATSAAIIRRYPAEEIYRKTEVLPFSSDRKYAACALEGKGSLWLGAPGFLFPDGCGLNEKISSYTSGGCRVLLLAASSQETCRSGILPSDLKPAALIVLKDVLRENAGEIMDYFKKQKVGLRVISGDDPATVSALAANAGIPGAEKYADMSKAGSDYDSLVDEYTVFGRVLPDQKKELIAALQRKGHCVAMTGDGVNDVPALKTADVSVAMASGAPAARDCANIVLLDSDFAVMPQIVDEGRRVINNITRASSMYLVKTVFSVLLSIYVVLFRQPYPFLPIHLTFISALGVGIPTFILQLEPSFERIRGRFLTGALRKAVPSSAAVFMIALFCLYLRSAASMDTERGYGVLVLLTGTAYLFTLWRVYTPLTKLRIAVIAVMVAAFFAGILLFPNTLSVRLAQEDLPVVLGSMAVIPFVILLNAKIYEAAAGKEEA